MAPLREFRHQYGWLISLLPALGGMTYGLNMGLNGLVVVQDSFINQFCVGRFKVCYKTKGSGSHASEDHEWVTFQTQFVAMLVLGCAMGAMVSTLSSEAFGRRNNIFIYSALIFASTIWLILETHTTGVLIARLLIGTGMGALSMIIPVYLAEISSTHKRGRTGGLMPITINTSVLLSAMLSKLLSQHPQGWKICYLVGLVPSVVLLICVFMAPESPRYLLKIKGRGSAERALRKLRNTADVQTEMDEMEHRIHTENSTSTWARLLVEFRPRLTVVSVLMFLAHLSGNSALLYYVPTILDQIGFSDKFLGTMMCYLVNLFGVVIAVLKVDDYGRRNLALLGGCGMLVGNLGAALLDVFGMEWLDPDGFSYLVACYGFLAFLCVYFLFFSCSFGAVLWVYPSEVFPLSVRTKAVSTASAVHFAASYLASYTLELIYFVGIGGALGCFAFICGVLIIYVHHSVPETAGKSLEGRVGS